MRVGRLRLGDEEAGRHAEAALRSRESVGRLGEGARGDPADARCPACLPSASPTVDPSIVERIFRQNISMGKGMGLMSMVEAVARRWRVGRVTRARSRFAHRLRRIQRAIREPPRPPAPSHRQTMGLDFPCRSIHRSPSSNDGRDMGIYESAAGSAAWNARPADPAHPDARRAARLRHRRTHPAAVRRRAAGGRELAVSGLQRLLLNGWVTAEWGASENNRRARYYTITADGRKRLAAERKEFQRIVGAIQQVLNPHEEAMRPSCVTSKHCCGGTGSRPSSPRNWKPTASCCRTTEAGRDEGAAAEAASRRTMGNMTLAREDARAAWMAPWLESVWQDLRYGVRHCSPTRRSR